MDTIPTDYCPDCRPLYGLPPTTGPVGTYDSCPACNPDTPILSCPEHRSPALADLALPANQYYYCLACDDEWCSEPTSGERLHDIGMAAVVLGWLTIQIAVITMFCLGFALALHQNYGYDRDHAIWFGALYGWLAGIFWVTAIFPGLFNLITEASERTWYAIRGWSL